MLEQRPWGILSIPRFTLLPGLQPVDVGELGLRLVMVLLGELLSAPAHIGAHWR